MRRDSEESLRVGFPLTSGSKIYQGQALSIQWLMQNSDYVKFWLDKTSNQLERVSSIYGAQGLECDYTGIFWGRDLLLRDGQWKLGDPAVCYDTIYGLVDSKTRKWANGALELVRNRYRIFLTRGMKGTFIFCEDEETRHYLLSLQSKLNPQ